MAPGELEHEASRCCFAARGSGAEGREHSAWFLAAEGKENFECLLCVRNRGVISCTILWIVHIHGTIPVCQEHFLCIPLSMEHLLCVTSIYVISFNPLNNPVWSVPLPPPQMKFVSLEQLAEGHAATTREEFQTQGCQPQSPSSLPYTTSPTPPWPLSPVFLSSEPHLMQKQMQAILKEFIFFATLLPRNNSIN